MPAVLQCPDPLCTHATGPVERRGKPAVTDTDCLVAEQLAVVAATAAIVCEPLCMSAPNTIMVFVPFTFTESGRPADMACWGRCHAPIKSRRDIPDRRRATQRKPVRPHGGQRESESARRRSEPLRETDVTSNIQTASTIQTAASKQGIMWKRYGSGKPQQRAAAMRGPSFAERPERQTAADRSRCSRLLSSRPARARHGG
jgi:hypothetical protein